MGIVSYYSLPNDNSAPNGTWMAEASEDSSYPATNVPLMTDLGLGNPGKLTIATTGGWMVNYGSAKRVDLVMAWHNMDSSQKLQIQGNATSNFAAPSLSTTVQAGAKREDGYTTKLYADLTLTSGYVSSGYQWWRFHFPATLSSNSANWGLKVWMGSTLRSLPRMQPDQTHIIDQHIVLNMTTDFGYSWRYDLQAAQRVISGVIPVASGGSYDNLLLLYRQCAGPKTPFLFVPDPSVNDAWLVRFGSIQDGWVKDTLDVAQKVPSYNPVTVTLEEVSGGGPEWS